ncbi:unnamed protein product, partial [Rotaria sordida]
SLAYSHNNIAIIHWKKGNKKQAIESYNKALKIWIEFYDALKYYEKALIIRLKHLPNEHFDIGDIYNNIGAVHRCLDHYDLALNYFSHSLEIYEKSLFPQHPSIASIYKNIGITYEIKKNLIQALEFYNKTAN